MHETLKALKTISQLFISVFCIIFQLSEEEDKEK